ncbi:hypothetical protein MPER_04987 [Moniliophthora perniciosa FA553]|nr:hypothetical protein MPER_04987 [Moniliophthora perniciosa FA553]
MPSGGALAWVGRATSTEASVDTALGPRPLFEFTTDVRLVCCKPGTSNGLGSCGGSGTLSWIGLGFGKTDPYTESTSLTWVLLIEGDSRKPDPVRLIDPFLELALDVKLEFADWVRENEEFEDEERDGFEGVCTEVVDLGLLDLC